MDRGRSGIKAQCASLSCPIYSSLHDQQQSNCQRNQICSASTIFSSSPATSSCSSSLTTFRQLRQNHQFYNCSSCCCCCSTSRPSSPPPTELTPTLSGSRASWNHQASTYSKPVKFSASTPESESELEPADDVLPFFAMSSSSRDYPEEDSASFMSVEESFPSLEPLQPNPSFHVPSGSSEGIRSVPLPGVRCPKCAEEGKEVWVIPGRACGYCGTPCF